MWSAVRVLLCRCGAATLYRGVPNLRYPVLVWYGGMHGTSVQQCLSSVPRFQAVSRQVSEAFCSRGRRVVVVVREVVEVTLLVVALSGVAAAASGWGRRDLETRGALTTASRMI